MDLPVMPPVAPMLAKAADRLPDGEGWRYEPKWDGFRCIVFRDGDDVELGSRNERPLTRYFPELVEALRANLPPRVVLDGEIVVVGTDGLAFDTLQQRIHPAESRIRRLAAETPAAYVAFDLLALDDRDVRGEPFATRRRLLEAALVSAQAPVHLTPITADRAIAADWFARFEGAGLDGVVAKPADLAYVEDKRVMTKVKHARTADCVVAGFRWHKDGNGIGSLLLGLFDDAGTLHHVGVATSFTAAFRAELVAQLAPLREGALDGHPWADWATASTESDQSAQRRPGAQSRWTGGKDSSWEPLIPVLVAEVAYDHLQGDRFRHATRLVHFRADRTPISCTYDQLERPVPAELADVFGAASD